MHRSRYFDVVSVRTAIRLVALVCLSLATAVAAPALARGGEQPARSSHPSGPSATDAAHVLEQLVEVGDQGIGAWLVSTGPDGHSHLKRVTFAGVRTSFSAGNGVATVLGMDNQVITYFSHQLASVTLYRSLGAVERRPHVAPGCEMFLILAGKTTYVGTDGLTQDFGPGDLVIFEDTTGTGHVTRTGPEGYTALAFSFVVQQPISAAAR